MDIDFDVWFSERSLIESEAVEATLGGPARARTWPTTRTARCGCAAPTFGDDKDRVLIKSDGEFTYLLPDIAYHRDKFARGFDLLIDVWGADHHGYVPRMKAAIQALGHDPDELEVELTQLVKLSAAARRSGSPSAPATSSSCGRSSTRSAPTRPGSPSCCSPIDTSQTFDIDVVKSQAMENPVFYVQMAYARIRSIKRVAAERGVERVPLRRRRLGAAGARA